jgi:hypothetical protein
MISTQPPLTYFDMKGPLAFGLLGGLPKRGAVLALPKGEGMQPGRLLMAVPGPGEQAKAGSDFTCSGDRYSYMSSTGQSSSSAHGVGLDALPGQLVASAVAAKQSSELTQATALLRCNRAAEQCV